MIIWKQWFTSVSDTVYFYFMDYIYIYIYIYNVYLYLYFMEVYFKLAYFNEWSHSAVGQSAYVIMPNFAKLIAIPFPFKK